MFCDVNKSHLLNDLSHSGSCREWTYLGWHWAERWGTLWTGCQPTAGLTQRDRLWLVSNWFPEQTTSFAWLSNKTKNVQLAPVGQAFSLDENFNSAVYGSICKTVINLWSGDFTLNKWVHRQKKWKETIQWFSPSVLKSSYSLFLSSADSPAHPQSVGCFTLFLSVEWKKRKQIHCLLLDKDLQFSKDLCNDCWWWKWVAFKRTKMFSVIFSEAKYNLH